MDTPSPKSALAITVLAAGGLGLYWAWDKFIRDENKEENQASAQDRYKDLQDAMKEERPTKPESAWSGFADQIYALLNGWAGENETEVERILKEPANLTDIRLLEYKFGARQFQNAFGFPDGEPKTLRVAVSTELWPSRVQRINEVYMKRGINYRF
ncbi:MAG: hypothetical protein NW241_10875 [Bacteroidia bacterium]|nr:hypothetical protein [Bacteroidia bacterium]